MRDTRALSPPSPLPWWPVTLPPFVLPAVLGLVQVVGTMGAAHSQPERLDLDGWAFALLLAGPVALLFRRRQPVAVFAVIAAVTAVYLGVGYPFGPVFFSLVVGAFVVVHAGHPVAAWTIATAAAIAFVLVEAVADRPGELTLWHVLGVVAWLVIPLTVAELARATRERAHEAARAQHEHVQRAASEERLRIAREVHDVLAHSISVINVQAGVALHLLDEHPEQAAPALAMIKETSREALAELGAVLAALRDGEDAVPLAPTPRLLQLAELVERATTPDLAIALTVDGVPRALAPAVDLAAYRVAQEALTNVRRHARAHHAFVAAHYDDAAVTITVDDDGVGGDPDRSEAGTGVAGMRERVRSLGGTFAAGRRPAGGFRVQAVIPYGEGA